MGILRGYLTIGLFVGLIAMPLTARAVTIPADLGSGTIDLDGWAGDLNNFGGDTLNALNSDPAGTSLSLVGSDGNGSYIELQFSMTGLSDLGISFATRGTSTGFNSGQWSYSTDGSSFTDFGTNTASTSSTWALGGGAPFSTSGLDGAATAYLRYTLGGATSGSGNNRIDNLLLQSSFTSSPTTLAYWNFNDFVPPPPPPPPTPRLPQPGDVVFGLSAGAATTTLELVSGPVSASGGVVAGTPWQSDPYIQSVEFDNYGGQLHNAHGNLLGVDHTLSGVNGESGGIYSFATNGSIPAAAGQLIGNTDPSSPLGQDGSLTQTSMSGLSVSPDNSKIAVMGDSVGRVIVYDYTEGDTMGSGAALTGGRETDAVFSPGSNQGPAWVDNNTVVAMNTSGDVYSVNASTMATTYETTVTTGGNFGTPVGISLSAMAYNPDVSSYLYAIASGFDSMAMSSQSFLYVLDPADSYNEIADVELSGSLPDTAREIALDADGNLYISTYGSYIAIVPDVVSNPAGIADNSSITWYQSGTFSSYNGLDIGFGEVTTLTGDYNGDGKVDAADYVLWRSDPGTYGGAQGYTDWRANFGASNSGAGSGLEGAAVPEPASLSLLMIGLIALWHGRRRA